MLKFNKKVLEEKEKLIEESQKLSEDISFSRNGSFVPSLYLQDSHFASFLNGEIADMDGAIDIFSKEMEAFAGGSSGLLYKCKSFIKQVKEFAVLKRENLAIDKMMETPESLETEKTKRIGLYASLIAELEEYKEKGKLAEKFETISFEDSLQGEKEEPFIRCENVAQFDTLFAVASSYAKNTRDSDGHSEKRHNEILEVLRKKLKQLTHMSSEEFRQDNVADMRFGEEERKMISEVIKDEHNFEEVPENLQRSPIDIDFNR